jgi:hypothetical protein
MTWKIYSFAVPSSRPASKPLMVTEFSLAGVASGLSVKRKAPLPEVRLVPAAPEKTKLPLEAAAVLL